MTIVDHSSIIGSREVRGINGMQNRSDLSIITISTNEGAELADCLKSIQNTAGDLRIEHFVIDNASNDNTAAVVAQYPDVIYIRNTEKKGFATNNNLALRRASGRYMLLLNPDTILEPDTLPTMIDYMDKHSEIGVAACKLVNPDGSIQYAARMFPTPLSVLMRWVGFDRVFPHSKTLTRYLLSDWDHETERDVDWVLGAFLLVRREVIDQVGILDESFDPLYYEDIDWCFRIKQAGWRIRYVPYVRIVHLYDRESAQSLFNKMMFHHLRNIIRFFWKHRRSRR